MEPTRYVACQNPNDSRRARRRGELRARLKEKEQAAKDHDHNGYAAQETYRAPAAHGINPSLHWKLLTTAATARCPTSANAGATAKRSL